MVFHSFRFFLYLSYYGFPRKTEGILKRGIEELVRGATILTVTEYLAQDKTTFKQISQTVVMTRDRMVIRRISYCFWDTKYNCRVKSVLAVMIVNRKISQIKHRGIICLTEIVK